MINEIERQVLDQRRRAFAFKPANWNRNAGARLQNEAGHKAMLRVAQAIGYTPGMRVVDFGGGQGGSVQAFIELGAPPATLTVLDVRTGEIEIGRQLRPGVDFRACDASRDVPFADATFDVALTSTVFYELADDVVRGMARQMRRVTKPGGHMIVRDWTMPRPGARAVTAAFIRDCFGLEIARIERGAMNQIIGRTFSAFLPALYYRVEPWCPWGMKLYVMKT